MKKRFILFVLLSIVLLSVHAQNEKSILWRITGNGLTGNHYLMGTIHVRDERAFLLPDSAYPALMRCNALALELQLDSAAGTVLQKYSDDYTSNSMKDIFSASELKKLKKKLAEKLGVNEEEIDKENPLKLMMRYEGKQASEGDMSTFLDAFLFDIARSNDKLNLGLETFEEQYKALYGMTVEDQKKMVLEMAETSVEEDKIILSNLKKIYYDQDIDSLYNYTSGKFSDDYATTVLDKRNFKMADRMDSLMKHHQLFTAVGAAHLAGNNGIISLLRKKGYTVTAVISKRSDNYKENLKKDEMKSWVVVYDSLNGYKVLMPGAPTEMNVAGFPMKSYFDMGKGAFYMSGAFPSYEESNVVDSKKISDDFAANYQGMAEVKSHKSVEYKGMKGAEFVISIQKSMTFTVQLFFAQNKKYLMMLGFNSEPKDKAVFSKYFSSLDVFKMADVGKEKTFIVDSAGFSCTALPDFKLMSDQKGDDYHLRMYKGNAEDGSAMYFTYCDYGSGVFFGSTKDVFDKCYEQVKDIGGYKLDTMYEATFQNYPSLIVRMSKGKTQNLFAQYILRGMRLYSISIDLSKKDIAIPGNFCFIPEKKNELKPTSIEECNCKFSMPGKVEKVFAKPDENEPASENKKLESIASIDKFSGQTFEITMTDIDKYTTWDTDTTYLRNEMSNLISSEDSVLKTEWANVNGHYQLRVTAMPKKNYFLHKHISCRANGDQFYTLVTMEDAVAKNSMCNEFFNSFSFIKDIPLEVSKDKTALLLRDCDSPDQEIRTTARNKFRQSEVKPQNLSLLEESFTKSFSTDSSDWFDINEEIFDKIVTIKANDKSLKNYFTDNYSKWKPVNQLQALEKLLLANDESHTLLFRKTLLSNSRPVTDNGYGSMQLLNHLNDSDRVTMKMLFPDLLKLGTDQFYASPVFYACKTGLEKKVLTSSDISDVMDSLAKSMKDWYFNYKRVGEYDALHDQRLIYAFSIFPYMKANADITDICNDLSKKKDDYSSIDAFDYLIKNNLPYDVKALERVCDDPYFILDMYDDLKRFDKLSAFPTAKLTQQNIARGILCSYLNYDEVYSETIKFASEKRIQNDGKTEIYYLYKVKLSDDKNEYFGIVGPFSSGQPIQTDVKYASMLQEKYDQAKAESILKKFLEENPAE